MDFVLPKKEINDYPGWILPMPTDRERRKAEKLGAKYLHEHKSRANAGTLPRMEFQRTKKKCTRCGKAKERTHFSPDLSKSDNKCLYCKSCSVEKNRESIARKKAKLSKV